jgi:hypothetical protein
MIAGIIMVPWPIMALHTSAVVVLSPA